MRHCACGCGHPIPADNPKRRYWSDACRRRAWQRANPSRRAALPASRTCACGCGETFPPVSRDHRFVSDAHRHRVYYREHPDMNAAQRALALVTLEPRPCECPCGREFHPARRDQRFRTGTCRHRAWRAKTATPRPELAAPSKKAR